MYLFNSGLVVPLSQFILSFNWLIVIGALMLVGWLATHVAHQVESKPLQYLAAGSFTSRPEFTRDQSRAVFSGSRRPPRRE